MNIPAAMTFKGFNDSNNTDFVPAVGEVFINKDTNELKVGDGKTKIADLPYISTTVSAPEPAKFEPCNVTKEYIKQYKDLIASNDFDEFYKHLEGSSTFVIRDVTKTLIEAGINIKEHLTTVPRCIQDMLLDKVDNLDNKIYTHDYNDWSVDMYTAREIDNMLENAIKEVTKKTYAAMSIPSHLITIKGE